ncbi:3-oxoacyl-[acyl-carrier-protein] synthase III C-terminal domain-containing protein [Coraliomargarita sp. SDUM461004]|uniref:3-oxoacyl-[acyl-carrier-protein] synthase III C-terminal domain-containing protein n=1 Tax=Thalassobacterium sedimentorum TaxID=3041258 RepID=A0ABU1AHM7_9BACT|nr:3-oxoacyl-[acyl-carrier-protein] synthase III C-terminal domain-containing protein [Coraliomargarita sp. SDUM461004]MDQ8194280.1 3-oxoacyl-[acyl-carrier-protein] synthase III C-terminal domain-containing protein [Coraliomargarita sp. SDUM461004]
MYLQSISHAVPPQSLTQSECWDILQNSDVIDTLKPRSQSILEKVLKGDSGIHKRHFATERVEDLFSLNAQTLNQNFEIEAPKLSVAALSDALLKADVEADALDALFICTCTGYLCPGLTSYVAEQMGISNRAFLQDIVGLGCGAAIPSLRSAQGFLAANPDATVACIAVEICSAAFYLDDDPGVLISASLFGDAAAATIWSGTNKGQQYKIDQFNTLHHPEQRELLRFTNSAGKLKNKLHRSVPKIAAHAVKKLYRQIDIKEPHAIAAHVGGRDVLDSLESTLTIPTLQASRSALADYGNTSSPSVLIAAQRILENTAPRSARIWLTSFGAGFAAHSCQLSNSTT